jgi:hypothetical protein
LFQGFLAVGELDPLNRRLGAQKKPDVVVQVVILAEDNEIRDKLAEHGLYIQTIEQVAPIEVQPARVLSHLYTYLGRNKKLGLSGRKSRDVGILSTSKLYSLKDRIFAFTPQVSWEFASKSCVSTIQTPTITSKPPTPVRPWARVCMRAFSSLSLFGFVFFFSSPTIRASTLRPTMN